MEGVNNTPRELGICGPPSARVVEALAQTEGVDLDELEYNLYDHVDPDAIDTLAKHDSEGWQLEFAVGDHDVSIRADGRVTVDGRTFR